MDIGNVLSRAWQIIWKHKVLWIFGILVGCSSGGGGGSSNFRTSYRQQAPEQFQPLMRFFENLSEAQIALIVGAIFLTVLVLAILAIFLSTIGRIGLIRGTQQVEGGALSLAFGELFRGSMPYFWRVFGLNLLVGLVSLAVLLPLTLLAVLGTVVTFGLGALCFIPLICLLIPLLWFVSVLVEQASIAIVLENLGILDGLRRGWEVVRNNLGTILLMALILILGIGGIGGFIIALPVAIIVIPAIIGAMAGTERALGGGLLIAGLCLVAYLPFWLILSGILRAYIESAWTLTYMRLSGAGLAQTAIAAENA
jgi:hypothetical protein